MRRKRRKHWAKSFGPYKCRVRVFQTPSGIIYAEVRTAHGTTRKSLKHRDRDRATRWAREEQARLALGVTAIETPTPTVARVFRAYKLHRTPKKGTAEQQEDARRIALWSAVLGEGKDLHALTTREWEEFAERRREGAITPRGKPVEKLEDRRPVRARAVAADLEWLRGVINWAVRWTDAGPDGGVAYLMRENPARGLEIPAEPNVRRPVATLDRYEAIRKVSDRVTMGVRRKKHALVRSYLSELLDLAHHTGRRVSAVLALRYEDLRLGEGGKHGAIRWSADFDKMAREWVTPINAAARAAIDRILAERPGLGRAYLFPSPANPERHVSKDLASAWLERAEALAKVPKMDGSLWHATGAAGPRAASTCPTRT